MKQKVECICGWKAFCEDRPKAVAAGKQHMKLCRSHAPVAWLHQVEVIEGSSESERREKTP